MPDEIDGGGYDILVETDQAGNSMTIRLTSRDFGIPLGTFLAAMRAPLKILEDLDRAASDGPSTLEWRIVDASYNSPLTLRVAGRPLKGKVGNGGIARAFVDGINALQAGGEPPQFSEAALIGARKFVDTISSDGIGEVEFACTGRAPVVPTKEVSKTVEAILRKRYFSEYSTIDGRLETLDLHGKSKFVVYDPLTRRPTNCFFPPELLEQTVAAIGKRVSVEGLIKFDRSGRPISMEVDAMRALLGSDDIPEFRHGRKVNLTNGVDAVEYVRRMRDAE